MPRRVKSWANFRSFDWLMTPAVPHTGEVREAQCCFQGQPQVQPFLFTVFAQVTEAMFQRLPGDVMLISLPATRRSLVAFCRPRISSGLARCVPNPPGQQCLALRSHEAQTKRL